jgi:hypothetical protein
LVANPATSRTNASPAVGPPTAASAIVEPGEQQQEAQVGHHGVPERGPPHGFPGGVVGEQQDGRAEGHHLPGEQEADDVPGRGHELQADREACERRPAGAGGRRPVRVPDPEQRAQRDDDAREQQEQPPEAVGREPQRLQPGDQRQRERDPETSARLAEQGGRAADGSREPRRQHGSAGRPVAVAGGHRDGEHRRDEPEPEQGQEAEVDDHRPVTARSAATIASGAGGQPGTWTSTST